MHIKSGYAEASYPSGKPQSPAQFPHLCQVSDPKHPFSKREARFMASVRSNDSPNPFPGLLSYLGNHTLGNRNTQIFPGYWLQSPSECSWMGPKAPIGLYFC